MGDSTTVVSQQCKQTYWYVW